MAAMKIASLLLLACGVAAQSDETLMSCEKCMSLRSQQVFHSCAMCASANKTQQQLAALHGQNGAKIVEMTYGTRARAAA